MYLCNIGVPIIASIFLSSAKLEFMLRSVKDYRSDSGLFETDQLLSPFLLSCLLVNASSEAD